MTTSILDAFPFPPSDPDGRRLLELLSQLYPTPDGANLVARMAGHTRRFNNPDPEVLWHDILTAGAGDGLNRRLVECVLSKQSPGAPARPFLESLLAGEPVAAEIEEAFARYRKSRHKDFDYHIDG